MMKVTVLTTLYVLKCKKLTNTKECEDDEIRLDCFTNSQYSFNYQLWVMIVINMKTNCKEIKRTFSLH